MKTFFLSGFFALAFSQAPATTGRTLVCENHLFGHTFRLTFNVKSSELIGDFEFVRIDGTTGQIEPWGDLLGGNASADKNYRPTKYKDYQRFPLPGESNDYALLLPKTVSQIESPIKAIFRGENPDGGWSSKMICR